MKNRADEIARTIHVGNINPQIQPQQLIDFFSVCGPIGFIRMVMHLPDIFVNLFRNQRMEHKIDLHLLSFWIKKELRVH